MIPSFKKTISLLLSIACVQAFPQTVATDQPVNPVGTSGSGLAEVFIQCKQPGKFVLTFDDGPSPAVTPLALDILKKENIKATFFINGQNYGDLINDQSSRDVVLRAYNEGHTIGSHTFYHKDLFEAMADGTLDDNIVKLRTTVKEIIGHEPAFFRPPNGNGGYTKEYCTRYNIPYDGRTETIREYLSKYGIKVIMWNADTRDWANKGNVAGAITELDRSINPPMGGQISPATNSFISLIHDVHQYSIETILPETIKHVRQLGYEFVSLPECIGESAYSDGSVSPNSEMNSNLVSENVTLVTASQANMIDSASSATMTSISMFSIIFTFAFILLSM